MYLSNRLILVYVPRIMYTKSNMWFKVGTERQSKIAKSLIQLRFGDPSVKPVKLHYVGDIKSTKEVH